MTDFLFRPGGNVYVFSYRKDGIKRHTFIDSGDMQYQEHYLDLLRGNNINPTRIERIVITHRHLDHCGLTGFLAGVSGARIMVHPGFRNFVEGRLRKEERWWLRGYDPSGLKKFHLEYLSLNRKNRHMEIGGIKFPVLGGPLNMGGEAVLEILACPESENKHTDDQVIALYSPSGQLEGNIKHDNDFRPSDDIVFCGDLWLMQGPFYEDSYIKQISHSLRFIRYRAKGLISGNPMPRMNIREQDAEAKEALKTGFNMIRVKPGHGEEFIGSRIIPQGILARRDLLLKLGLGMNQDKSLLKRNHFASKIMDLREEAYARFMNELVIWREWGYSPEEISRILIRIYREQKGGGRSIKKDRKERRAWLKATLIRLRNDDHGPDSLRVVAESTLMEI